MLPQRRIPKHPRIDGQNERIFKGSTGKNILYIKLYLINGKLFKSKIQKGKQGFNNAWKVRDKLLKAIDLYLIG